jgi:ligand-binding sensor domain-containing protein
MARFEQIRERLPTLYRPEGEDDGLLTLTLRAVADVMEELNREASDVLQAHWFGYADAALYDPYFIQSRRLGGLPPPTLDDPTLEEFPYVHDLARLAALLALPPWQDPLALRETVEQYRQRIRRVVKLYTNGLGTPGAMRRMIEAQLPVDLGAALKEEEDRPFSLEEFAPLVTRSQAIAVAGEPSDIIGPLMRWTVENDSLVTALPTIYVQGVEPDPPVIAATKDPLIELYHGSDGLPPLGLAYQDTVAPGETLRLRPAYASWIGLDNGLKRARSRPTASAPADPTAPGPWHPVGGAPETAVAALHQSHDRALWVATDEGDLWRFDGQGWVLALSDVDTPHCLAEDGEDLLIGTADGLVRMPLYPADDDPFVDTPVPGLENRAVYALLYADGRWWLGTSEGIFLLEDSGEVRPFGLREDQDTAVEVYAVHQDTSGTLYFGTELGLFQHQPGTGRWYYYAGGTSSDQGEDWKEFVPGDSGDKGELPGESGVYLPPVRAVYRGPDASLWLGTDHGIARYLARPVREFAYETVLEAFPDLSRGRVYAIEEDARGLVWFCTDRGLLRYDGRDWWQPRTDGWKQLGAAAYLYDDEPEPRGSWRFVRASSKWETFAGDGWREFAGALRTTNPTAVRVITWTDQVEADRGQWDGQRFTPSSGVSEAKLRMRCKPREDAVFDGGLPAVPRLPVGQSEWRYLSLEPNGLEEPRERPSWTIEGRLRPPPELPAPWPGRYDMLAPPQGLFDEAVFAFEPAARVWFELESRRPLTVVARLQRRSADENIDPAILDRVWQGIQQVRPAGVRTLLAVEEEIVRGGTENG